VGVANPVCVLALETGYPARLRNAREHPPSITYQGGSLEAAHVVAVVGSRSATEDALAFARELAATLARAGAVVVSGGARGVDAAAHEGALHAGGRTWAVAGTGQNHCFPPDHAPLFDRIGGGPGAMIWPFAPDFRERSGFLARNRVLVALADAVVVVQAGAQSGALHAASWARKLGKPLWVVPAPPWMPAFAGSRVLLEEGAHPVTSIDALLRALHLELSPAGSTSPPPPSEDDPAGSPAVGRSPDALAALAATSTVPLHQDVIAVQAGLDASAVGVALLTLALENVVVEGPPGFYRQGDARKR
jgi:DNA processing protein